MHQEPGANSKEILNGLKCVRPGNGFQPNFPLFQKIQVNGKDEDQIYTYLKVINWLFLGLISIAYIYFITSVRSGQFFDLMNSSLIAML